MDNQIAVALSSAEYRLLRELGATAQPKVVECKYLAIYRLADKEVQVRSVERPPKRRTFRSSGEGRRKFTRVRLYKIHTKESTTTMATRTRSKKKQNTKDEESEDVEELEGLEELEEIEAEEPDEDEETEEEEKPKRRKRTSKKTSKKKAAVVEEDEDEEKDEEDDEDEDEEEEPAPKKSKKSSKSVKKTSAGKKSAKKDSESKKSPGKTTKELTGGVGTAELAEAASEIAEMEITGRDVRVYLRKNEIEKDEEAGRYTWPSLNNKGFKKLAKDIAKEFAEE